jgi:hypothetical protein
MRRPDDGTLDPGIVATLDAIDATLAGDPVDPAHAEFAELALLLAAERPSIDPRFADGLDRAVDRRFAPAAQGSPGRPARVVPALRRRWWLWTPAGGLAAALVAAIVIVAAGGTSQPVTVTSSAGSAEAKLPSPSAGQAKPTPPDTLAAPSRTGASAPRAATPTSSRNGASASSGAAATSSSSAASSAGGALGANSLAPAQPLQPPSNGRKIIQGAQLALTTAPSRIDQVAQEVFTVVGRVRGIVSSSTVTAASGPGGYAQFQLSIPSSQLSQAMTSLSKLPYAKVASRTDNTQDVNNQYQADVRRLADARALRTSLLKQLADAATQAQIDSLTARIHDAEASISSDEATLRGLNRQINYSRVSLTINGGPVPVPLTTSHGGFGIGRAAHDAGRVLTVAAGIALIAAAALVPVVLLGGLAWWIAAAVRRRRREHALDLV